MLQRLLRLIGWKKLWFPGVYTDGSLVQNPSQYVWDLSLKELAEDYNISLYYYLYGLSYGTKHFDKETFLYIVQNDADTIYKGKEIEIYNQLSQHDSMYFWEAIRENEDTCKRLYSDLLIQFTKLADRKGRHLMYQAEADSFYKKKRNPNV